MIDALVVHSEPLLMALAAGLYVVDCGRLLRPGESLATGTVPGALKLILPEHGFRFQQRMAVFPSLLSPGSVTLRFRESSASGGADTVRGRLDETMRRLIPASRLCPLLMVLMFVAVPVAFVLDGYGVALLVVLLLIYGVIIGLNVWLWLRRQALDIPPLKAAMISFETLICIPYAVNFHRKVFDLAMHHGKWLPADSAAALVVAR